jgi:hypothetical protein
VVRRPNIHLDIDMLNDDPELPGPEYVDFAGYNTTIANAMGGQASSNTGRVLAELANERFCKPRPTEVSGTLDALRKAFVDRTLEVGMHVASKAPLLTDFAKATPSSLPGRIPRS